MKKGRQAKAKFSGQPAPRWPQFMLAAMNQIATRGGFDRDSADAITQIAAEIVRHGDGEKFLKSVRRGRSTQRQNLRFQLLREVEAAIGAAVPRRREDRNTPEVVRMLDPGATVWRIFQAMTAEELRQILTKAGLPASLWQLPDAFFAECSAEFVHENFRAWLDARPFDLVIYGDVGGKRVPLGRAGLRMRATATTLRSGRWLGHRSETR